MDLATIIALTVFAALGMGISFAGLRHDRFGRLFVALVVVAGALVTFDVIAISTGFHNADGITDCWPNCSAWQGFVKTTLFGGALLWLIIILVAIRGSGGRRG